MSKDHQSNSVNGKKILASGSAVLFHGDVLTVAYKMNSSNTFKIQIRIIDDADSPDDKIQFRGGSNRESFLDLINWKDSGGLARRSRILERNGELAASIAIYGSLEATTWVLNYTILDETQEAAND